MASVDMHDIDLKEFNEVLAACKGDVFMVTPEGDRLNPVSDTQLPQKSSLRSWTRAALAACPCASPRRSTASRTTPRCWPRPPASR